MNKLFMSCALIGVVVLFCSFGCLPLTGYWTPDDSHANTFAEDSIDIVDSSPDLALGARQPEVRNILRQMGADGDFVEKKRYFRGIDYKYSEVGILENGDDLLLYTDDTEHWINIIVIKGKGDKTLLWIRRPTYNVWNEPPFQPSPGSLYDKDWVRDIREECARRGIRVVDDHKFTLKSTPSS